MERKTIAIENVLITIDRQEGGMGNIDSLAASISRNGLINPITVVQFAPGEYEIIAGRRRLDAAKSLGWTEIPASVYDSGELREEEVQIAENVNRLDMHPLDEAVLYKKLLDHGEPLVEIAKISGRSKSAVYQRVELLRLIPGLKNRFRNGGLTMTQASMLGSFSPDSQISFEDSIKDFSANEPIPFWKFKQGCVRFGGVDLRNTKFAKCSDCKTRTHYSDVSLFPELEGESDQCLNRDCFEEQYIAWVQGVVRFAYEKQGVSFREIDIPPILIEDSDIDILTKEFKNGLLIDSAIFPVISDNGIVIIENELDSSDAPEWQLACRDSIKPCFFISSKMYISFYHYVTSDEYRNAKYGPDDEDDDEDDKFAASLTSEAEKDAYREVMNSQWSIMRLAKEKILSQIALENYDTVVHHSIFEKMISKLCNSETLIKIVQNHNAEFDIDTISNGSAWTDGWSLESLKTLVYDTLLHKAVNDICLTLPDETPFTDDVLLLKSLGVIPELISEQYQTEYEREIKHRINEILDIEIPLTEEEERGAVSADTFSSTGTGEEESPN